MNDTKRRKDMKRRRVKGARLLEQGEQPAEVARRTGVSRQSVMRWQQAIGRWRDQAARAAWPTRTSAAIVGGPTEGAGAVFETRGAGCGVCHGDLDGTTHRRIDCRAVRRAHGQRISLAGLARADGL